MICRGGFYRRTSVAKAAACKLGFLFTQLLTLYKAQIRPCLEYCSHLWRGASKHSLATLDAIQRRAIRLIGDPALTDTLDSLAHRRSVSLFTLSNAKHGKSIIIGLAASSTSNGPQVKTMEPMVLIKVTYCSIQLGFAKNYMGFRPETKKCHFYFIQCKAWG